MKPMQVGDTDLGRPRRPDPEPTWALAALAAELGAEGVSVRDLFARTGVDATQLEDAQARISHHQRLAIYRNAKRLAKRSDVGLLAGARQTDQRLWDLWLRHGLKPDLPGRTACFRSIT